MDGAKEDLVDMFIVHTTEEIQVGMIVSVGAGFVVEIRVRPVPVSVTVQYSVNDVANHR